MTCSGLTPFVRGPQSLDLDELELDAREVAVTIYGIGYAEPAWSGVATKHPHDPYALVDAEIGPLAAVLKSCTSARSPRR